MLKSLTTDAVDRSAEIKETFSFAKVPTEPTDKPKDEKSEELAKKEVEKKSEEEDVVEPAADPEEDGDDENEDEGEEDEEGEEETEDKVPDDSFASQMTELAASLTANQLATNQALISLQEQVAKGQVVATPTPSKPVDIEFVNISKEEAEDMLADPMKLAAMLNKVGNEAYRRAVSDTKQSYRSEIPALIDANATQRALIEKASNRFWTENKDLLKGKTGEAIKDRMIATGTIASVVATEHPDWTMPQIEKETSNRARAMFGVETPGKKRRRRGKPKFAVGTGGRKKAPVVTSENTLAADIEATFSSGAGYPDIPSPKK